MKIALKNTGLKKASKVEIPENFLNRVPTRLVKIDRVLNGGFVKGQIFVLSAEAGTGKTTMLLGILSHMHDLNSAYLSGEECEEQLALSCKRIGVDVMIGNIKNIDEICEIIRVEKLELVILDSVPSLETTEPMNAKEKEDYITSKIVDVAKSTGCIIGCILHMTKDGEYKGGSGLVHAIDSEFYLTKDKANVDLRILSSKKNRFGGSNVEAELLMTPTGMDFNFNPEDFKRASMVKLSEDVINFIKANNYTFSYTDLYDFDESQEKDILNIVKTLKSMFGGFEFGDMKKKNLKIMINHTMNVSQLNAKLTRDGWMYY